MDVTMDIGLPAFKAGSFAKNTHRGFLCSALSSIFLLFPLLRFSDQKYAPDEMMTWVGIILNSF
jgi:hypothetical protein